MTDDPASPTPLSYGNPKKLSLVRRWGRRDALVLSLLAIGGLVLLVSLIPRHGRAGENSNRIKCASNLSQIGRAAWAYVSNQGRWPKDLSVLCIHGDLAAEDFICPSQNSTRAAGSTPQDVADGLLEGGHLDYAWVGSGFRPDLIGPDVVLAFDMEFHVPTKGTRTTGINALMGDGTVQFLDEQSAKGVRAQFAAGVRPIRLPVTPYALTQPAMR